MSRIGLRDLSSGGGINWLYSGTCGEMGKQLVFQGGSLEGDNGDARLVQSGYYSVTGTLVLTNLYFIGPF